MSTKKLVINCDQHCELIGVLHGCNQFGRVAGRESSFPVVVMRCLGGGKVPASLTAAAAVAEAAAAAAATTVHVTYTTATECSLVVSATPAHGLELQNFMI